MAMVRLESARKTFDDGAIWANHMRREGATDASVALPEVSEWLAEEHGVVALGALGFENAYALAMRRRRADRIGAAIIADIAPHAPGWRIGGDYEFFGRPEWVRIREEYAISFADRVRYDSTFIYEAVRRGEVEVISAFTSDGRIEAFDLVTLDDPRDAIPPTTRCCCCRRRRRADRRSSRRCDR